MRCKDPQNPVAMGLEAPLSSGGRACQLSANRMVHQSLTSFGSRRSKFLLARLVRGFTFTSSLFRFTMEADFGLHAAALIAKREDNRSALSACPCLSPVLR